MRHAASQGPDVRRRERRRTRTGGCGMMSDPCSNRLSQHARGTAGGGRGPEPLDGLHYGESATDLETLRRLVAARCPHVGFGGHTPSGARTGEYSFRPVAGRSAWVQAPVTPTGRSRAGGRWRFRLSRRPGQPRDPWEHADTVHRVVDWICAKAPTTKASW